ncbi:uncharacterized protein VTP21DRAFT_7532 [Calcarisporiella thermophila]|uniref:uncharacterized protein n=1 Tax=Calcarisporiella thermophila TaxID=911321 RepID=UPI003741F044
MSEKIQEKADNGAEREAVAYGNGGNAVNGAKAQNVEGAYGSTADAATAQQGFISRIFSNRLTVRFDTVERRNLIIYTAGIMFFKFAFEFLNNCISNQAQSKFPKGISITMNQVLTASFNLAQILASIAGAQIIQYVPTNRLLAFSMFGFGLLALIMVILEAATGGQANVLGTWTPWLLFAFYLPMGACLGVVELLRRVIPRDIMGGNPEKLRKMDALVHIWYEIAGTIGAFVSTPIMQAIGFGYPLAILAVLMPIAGVLWWQIRLTADKIGTLEQTSRPKLSVIRFFTLYFHSAYLGAKIVFSSRRFIWLIPGYAIPLVLHRFIESTIFPTFAKNVLNQGALSGVLLGSSNFGELLGALSVLLFSAQIRTPLPWVRLDAIMLSTLWIFPFLYTDSPVTFVCAAIPLMILLSGGWAAGDVSLAAYIQTQISGHVGDDSVSPLGAVMAFLYSTYLVVYTVYNGKHPPTSLLTFCLDQVLIFFASVVLMGMVFDYYKNQGNIRLGFFYVVGVGISIVAMVLMFASTFIPKGSFAINPEVRPEDIPKEEPQEAEKVERVGIEDVIAL